MSRANSLLMQALLWFLLWFAPQAVRGQEDFDDESTLDMEIEMDSEETTPSDLDGKAVDLSTANPVKKFISKTAHFTFSQEFAYRIEPAYTTMNRSSLKLQWEYLYLDHFFLRLEGKVAYDAVYDYRSYPETVEDEYKFHTISRDIYIQGNYGKLSVKLGKHRIIWGKADGAIVTDIISPKDMRDGLFTPVGDTRIGQYMLTTDLYLHSNQLTFVYNPFPETNRFPLSGHEYAFPDEKEIFDVGSIENSTPPQSFSDPEVGIRLNRVMTGMDLAIIGAQVFSDDPVFSITEVGGKKVVSKEYPKYEMVGLGLNLSLGNFLWKGELAYKKKKAYTSQKNGENTEIVKSDLMESALGFDYSPGNTFQLTVEGAAQYIKKWDESYLGVNQYEGTFFASISKPFIHETLTPQYTFVYQFVDKASMHLSSVTYQINDQWKCSFEIDYIGRNRLTQFLEKKKQHRFFAELEFDF